VRLADLFEDPVDVCCGAASDFHNGKIMAAAAATARTAKIKILRIICASFGLVEVRQHSPVILSKVEAFAHLLVLIR
jgi:hypothetical protein